MATKSIGAGLDYATIALWEDYADSVNGTGIFTEDELGQINNEEIVQSTGDTVIDGQTTGAFSMILEAQSGDSFRDNANKLTNALRYNSANGACWRATAGSTAALDVADIGNFVLRNLMLKNSGGYGRLFRSAASTTIENCIFDQDANNAAVELLGAGATSVVNSCLVINNGADNANTIGIFMGALSVTLFNCTVARTVAVGTQNTGISAYSGTTRIASNCVVENFVTDYFGAFGAGSTNNATDQADITAAGATGIDGSEQENLVGATEWESVTDGSEDFRVKSTSVKLKDNGTATGDPATDIVGQSRSGSTDIGVWEFQAGGSISEPIVQQFYAPDQHRKRSANFATVLASGGVLAASPDPVNFQRPFSLPGKPKRSLKPELQNFGSGALTAGTGVEAPSLPLPPFAPVPKTKKNRVELMPFQAMDPYAGAGLEAPFLPISPFAPIPRKRAARMHVQAIQFGAMPITSGGGGAVPSSGDGGVILLRRRRRMRRR